RPRRVSRLEERPPFDFSDPSRRREVMMDVDAPRPGRRGRLTEGRQIAPARERGEAEGSQRVGQKASSIEVDHRASPWLRRIARLLKVREILRYVALFRTRRQGRPGAASLIERTGLFCQDAPKFAALFSLLDPWTRGADRLLKGSRGGLE